MEEIAIVVTDDVVIAQASEGAVNVACDLQEVIVIVEGGTPGEDGGYVSPDLITISANGTYNIAAGKLLMAIAVNKVGSGDRVINVGTTAGGTELIDNGEIPNNTDFSGVLGRYFSTATTIHFSGFTGSIQARIYVL